MYVNKPWKWLQNTAWVYVLKVWKDNLAYEPKFILVIFIKGGYLTFWFICYIASKVLMNNLNWKFKTHWSRYFLTYGSLFGDFFQVAVYMGKESGVNVILKPTKGQRQNYWHLAVCYIVNHRKLSTDHV